MPSGGHPWLVTSLLEVAGPSGFIGGSEKACARLREEGAESYVGDVGVYQLWAHLLDL